MTEVKCFRNGTKIICCNVTNSNDNILNAIFNFLHSMALASPIASGLPSVTLIMTRINNFCRILTMVY
jgi:hypothetical protein